MLSTRLLPAAVHTDKPTLVFLHGLLGGGDDWKLVLPYITVHDCLLIDLPGHGGSVDTLINGYDSVCKLISESIRQSLPPAAPIVIIGYSLGARLAMYGLSYGQFNSLNVIGYMVEAGNFGLVDEKGRQCRLQNDQAWATRFAHQPIKDVLEKWYCQPVFSSLSEVQRLALIQERKKNNGKAVANMLMATSLAKQPYLLDKLMSSNALIHYICGEKDNKFSELAKLSGLSFTKVKEAGHNVHHEQPARFATLIQQQTNLFLDTSTESGINHGKNSRNY